MSWIDGMRSKVACLYNDTHSLELDWTGPHLHGKPRTKKRGKNFNLNQPRGLLLTVPFFEFEAKRQNCLLWEFFPLHPLPSLSHFLQFSPTPPHLSFLMLFSLIRSFSFLLTWLLLFLFSFVIWSSLDQGEGFLCIQFSNRIMIPLRFLLQRNHVFVVYLYK